jgi:alpha-amylase/alpha-mannosidase (GH57 family)
MTAYWAQLLHFYQPPTQTHDVLERIAKESYRPLLDVLLDHPEARIGVNINAVLTEMLAQHGFGDVIAGLRKLVKRGQVEVVGSGKFHPILPLIPEEFRRQAIADHASTNARLAGAKEAPEGFFPPELCYSSEIVPAVADSGASWMLLSGIACSGDWPTREIQRVEEDGRSLSVLYRDDVRSNRISFRETDPKAFVADVASLGTGPDAYVVTAMDAETYGHHIKGWEREFLAATYELVAKGHEIRMVQPGELAEIFPAGPVVEPKASSWSTTSDDILAGNPYPLWRSPGNSVHELQWQFVDLCLALLGDARRYAKPGTEAAAFVKLANDLAQPGLHSCQFWWASRRPHWDVPMIYRGFQLLTGVMLYASKAVYLGDAPKPVKRDTGWRVAGAAQIRRTLENALFSEKEP